MIDTIEEFIRCAESKEMKDYHRITLDQFTDEVWKEIMDHYPQYHYWVDGNRYLPEWVMWEFSMSKEQDVKRTIAERHDIPETLLRKLSEDADPDIRSKTAWNLSCPRDVLERLSIDKSPRVREGVASNMRCPKDLLRKLAKDKSVYVRNKTKRRLEVMQVMGIPKIPEYWHISPNYEWVPDPNPDE